MFSLFVGHGSLASTPNLLLTFRIFPISLYNEKKGTIYLIDDDVSVHIGLAHN